MRRIHGMTLVMVQADLYQMYAVDEWLHLIKHGRTEWPEV